MLLFVQALNTYTPPSPPKPLYLPSNFLTHIKYIADTVANVSPVQQRLAVQYVVIDRWQRRT